MNSTRMMLLWSGGGVLCFLFSVAWAVSFGSVKIPLADVWKVVVNQLYPFFHIDLGTHAIVWEIRLPRVLLSAVIGSSLAVAGVIFQGLLQNHLADPYVLGVSSGSAAGAVIGIVLGFSSAGISVFAFVGACMALLMVLFLAQENNHYAVNRLILSGVVIQAFFGAVVSFFLSFSYSKVQTIVYWLLGSFSLAKWKDITLMVTFFITCFIIAMLMSRQLNILSFGDRTARHLGIAVSRIRLLLLLVASLITAISVSVSGTIGFIGLVIPHITRFFVGMDHRFLIPSVSIIGAIFTVWADWFSRVILSPQELPIGVITAMIGTPFFAYLLYRGKYS